MSLHLYSHPLASFCHKVLIALYENGTPFQAHLVDLGDPGGKADFLELWPVGKMPVLRDEARERTVPETSIIIEYLQQHHPGPRALLPDDADARLDVRLWDRFFDLYVHAPMQRIVLEELRGANEKDPRGVADARATLATAYAMIERRAPREWICGDEFTLADCAAAPALFYAAIVAPFAPEHTQLDGYYQRLMDRASVRRTLSEARPYFPMFPLHAAIPARFLQD
ncbi:glutathione S-transferase family protein [Lysobacter enzymogenes]|uniref:Glutathione S-transferase domain protein n=1 Tax=Lysobacter enzymogenes TaxID=69 RepID=A0AAU9ABZ6_LYSEN|nr:glutathione S-transferase family protein [Lysobacter enzymogenes]BAV96307.1 glutathione S-transferase domain protein [Lysobacter enzymogenes]